MASAALDLSQVQTINYGGGQSLLYDPTTGNYYDNGGNQLQPSDVAQYGAPVSVASGINAAPGAPAPAGAPSQSSSPTGGATTGLLSTMTSILGSVGGVGSALNPPKTVNGVPMVYSSALGTYIPLSSAGNAASNLSLSPVIIVVGLAAVVVLAWFAFK